MSSIDTLILGLIIKNNMSAYDVQREIENRNINKWVRISTPSIYKKMITYQEKGYLTTSIKERDKTIYSITEKGISFYKKCVQNIAEKEINIFFEFNSVITNFDNFSEKEQYDFLITIKKKLFEHLLILNDNMNKKSNIPEFGKQIFKQQLQLLTNLESWLNDYIEMFE